MKTFIALFRGINVGGNNKLPMKELVAVLEELGLQNVRTYIQSGNVVFQDKANDAAKRAAQIGAAIMHSHGFAPKVMLLEATALEQAIKVNPYPEAEAAPNTLHLNFLDAIPAKPNLDALEKIRAPSERFFLKDKVVYLHAPDGVGRSKLAANTERLLDVAMTSRNWNTVCKLREMSREM